MAQLPHCFVPWVVVNVSSVLIDNWRTNVTSIESEESQPSSGYRRAESELSCSVRSQCEIFSCSATDLGMNIMPRRWNSNSLTIKKDPWSSKLSQYTARNIRVQTTAYFAVINTIHERLHSIQGALTLSLAGFKRLSLWREGASPPPMLSWEITNRFWSDTRHSIRLHASHIFNN